MRGMEVIDIETPLSFSVGGVEQLKDDFFKPIDNLGHVDSHKYVPTYIQLGTKVSTFEKGIALYHHGGKISSIFIGVFGNNLLL